MGSSDRVYPIQCTCFALKILQLSVKKCYLAMPLSFELIKECISTRARASKIHLPHFSVEGPIFMPVGTQGTMKGLTPQQLLDINCQIILGNTYHLGLRPVDRWILCPIPFFRAKTF